MKTTSKLIVALVLALLTGSLQLMAQKTDDSRVKVLTESTFAKEIKSGIVIVDFYADWCRPCVAMAPILEQAAFETEGKLSFAKINVDNAKNLSAQYNVNGIPCLIVFDKGKEVDRIVGYHQKDALMQKLQKYLL